MRLIYLSPLPWASFIQRPHQFAIWFHQRHQHHGRGDGEVLWIDPYPTRLPTLADLRRRPPAAPTVATPQPDWLRVIRPRALPIEPLPGSGGINRWLWCDVFAAVDEFRRRGPALLAAGKPSELVLQLLARAPELPSLYDAMDDFPHFYAGLSRQAMARREQLLSSRVASVLVSSSELEKRLGAARTSVRLVPNACAPESLPAVADLPQRGDDDQRVLGFVGTIGAWFDWEWLLALAQANANSLVRLIGPLHQPPPRPLPANVELRPACDHATAIAAMTQFDVGLIPFRDTELTRSVDPIKYYEYRALGLPVLSTRFGEMALRGTAPGVMLASVGDDLARAVDSATAVRSSRDEIKEFRKLNSWAARFDAAGMIVD